MEDFDFDPAEELASSAGRGRGGKGSGRGGRGSKVVAEKTCWICEENRLKNSKWCREHHRAVESMRYQATMYDRVVDVIVSFSELERVLAKFCF
eukprot:6489472-Amphidinium_carterae.1